MVLAVYGGKRDNTVMEKLKDMIHDTKTLEKGLRISAIFTKTMGIVLAIIFVYT